MKVSLMNHSDSSGGAARAAFRIHQAVQSVGVESVMWVNRRLRDDWTVVGPAGKWAKGWELLRPPLGGIVGHLLKTDNRSLHSPAFVPSAWSTRVNTTDITLVHFHWINAEMMSVRDIGCVAKPIIWTLHDMWPFCGAEHYTDDFRWRDGYRADNRPTDERGFDLNRWAWTRKRKAWTRPMHIVAPSHWMGECARESVLMRDWPISVIHNAIDVEQWRPVDKQRARELLGLPDDAHIVLFGAMGGGSDRRKGFDLLREALRELRKNSENVVLVVFGQGEPKEPEHFGFKTVYLGHLSDDLSLKIVYSAADVMVIPSRQDNLPNTGVESLACGTPIVAFDACGMPDLVKHRETGYLARPFDTEELAVGIQWVISEPQRLEALGVKARADAVARFSYDVVGKQYSDVYHSMCEC